MTDHMTGRSPFETWTEIDAHDFEVTPAHIALLRRANTGWEGPRRSQPAA